MPAAENAISGNVFQPTTEMLYTQCTGSWASAIVMVRKNDQTYRLCVDCRDLNEYTVKDAYPLPCIQNTLDPVIGQMVFHFGLNVRLRAGRAYSQGS